MRPRERILQESKQVNQVQRNSSYSQTTRSSQSMLIASVKFMQKSKWQHKKLVSIWFVEAVRKDLRKVLYCDLFFFSPPFSQSFYIFVGDLCFGCKQCGTLFVHENNECLNTFFETYYTDKVLEDNLSRICQNDKCMPPYIMLGVLCDICHDYVCVNCRFKTKAT